MSTRQTLTGLIRKGVNNVGRKAKRLKRLLRQANSVQEQTVIRERFNLLDAPTKANEPIKPRVQSWEQARHGYMTNQQIHAHNITEVATLDNLTLFAATKYELDYDSLQTYDIDLIINCSQAKALSANTAKNNLVSGIDTFNELNNLLNVVTAKELQLDWSDGGGWQGSVAFWQKLYYLIQQEGFKRIVFTCFGGHGRTGTGLLSFLIANATYQANSSELWLETLRALYCKDVVETTIQENYLEQLELKVYREKLERSGKLTWAKEVATIKLNIAEMFTDGNSVEVKLDGANLLDNASSPNEMILKDLAASGSYIECATCGYWHAAGFCTDIYSTAKD